mmetsp:Transcript_30332/g.50100  ORF Transcript_30332/g.50100 Transcript_30332/m.50100 type:complete len:105 (+) Transcript_30332:119-433(+)|eukprot:CAMPEP_0119013962 /NCGR_PEP_ID=MMETSP1176-20130426/9281_1 /TAXON_ID=265551 /ORGANISM="Synedropsis recta cf, Strain CCMP1620" /LENGTH=104 /DNA_ID=CAMNT_0006967093 /DNA_START=116 /DNA_END=430 /DNA_ORIENTATION=-
MFSTVRFQIIRLAAKRRATATIGSRQFAQHPVEERASMWDEPWVAILGGGILSFGGLWFMADLEISAKETEEGESLVKHELFDDDLLGEEPTKKRSATKKFSPF